MYSSHFVTLLKQVYDNDNGEDVLSFSILLTPA